MLGAAAVDVTSDVRQEKANRSAQVVQMTTPQATAYATMADCVNAAARQGLPASTCQKP